MTPLELERQCIEAVQRRQRTLTLTLPANFKRPPGWPHGELLSVNAKGHHNYSYDPLQLLGYLIPLVHSQPRSPL